MHYLFRVICFEYRIVGVDYFMDTMQYCELPDMINNIKYLDKNSREIDRYKLFVTVQANSKKKVKIEELMPLAWDEERKTLTKISKEEQKQLRERANQLSKKISQVKSFEAVDMQKYADK